MPLLVEASTRFQILSGVQGAVALSTFSALALMVAVRRDLQSLAWLTSISGSLTALILLRATHQAVPFGVFLLILGLASLWVVYSKGWKGLHWLGALSADLGVAIVALLSTTDQWSIPPGTAYLLALALLLVYPLSFAARSHLQRRIMGAFEVAQGLLVIGIVFWIANVTSTTAGGLNTLVLGSLCLLMGVGSYALAFTPETRSIRGRNFFFYTTVGLILVVGGSAMVMTPGKAAAAWSLMAVFMAFFSGQYARVTLSLQCTLLLLAAGVASGGFATGLQALTSSGAEGWPSVEAWPLIVAVATVLCLFIPVAQQSERWGVLAGALGLGGGRSDRRLSGSGGGGGSGGRGRPGCSGGVTHRNPDPFGGDPGALQPSQALARGQVAGLSRPDPGRSQADSAGFPRRPPVDALCRPGPGRRCADPGGKVVATRQGPAEGELKTVRSLSSRRSRNPLP